MWATLALHVLYLILIVSLSQHPARPRSLHSCPSGVSLLAGCLPISSKAGSAAQAFPSLAERSDRAFCAALPVALAAGIAAPSSALTYPDLNSPLGRAGSKQTCDCDHHGENLLHGKVVFVLPLEHKPGSFVTFVLGRSGKGIAVSAVSSVELLTSHHLLRLQRKGILTWSCFFP